MKIIRYIFIIPSTHAIQPYLLNTRFSMIKSDFITMEIQKYQTDLFLSTDWVLIHLF